MHPDDDMGDFFDDVTDVFKTATTPLRDVASASVQSVAQTAAQGAAPVIRSEIERAGAEVQARVEKMMIYGFFGIVGTATFLYFALPALKKAMR